jgi:PadR family transcriptional regulator
MTGAGDRRSQWLKGVLELCVLATLRDRARYGYEIGHVLAEAGVGDIKGGTLYPVLARLEQAGLVRTDWRPGDAGPNRKYYALTPSGLDSLGQLARDWTGFTATIDSLVSGVTARER